MNTQPQLFKQKVRIFNQYVGVLGHDNKLFDRTCPNCHGWYDSSRTATCPSCGAALTFLTSKAGKKMAVSEGTFYPILGDQEEKDKEQTLARGGLLPTYRFKMFSFAGPDEPLIAPVAHMHCRKRAVVKLTIVNHQAMYKSFNGEDGPHVEIMLPIYAGFGDKVEVIQDPKEVAAYEDSIPAGPDPELQKKMVALQKQIAQLKGQLASQNPVKAAPDTPTVPPDIAHAYPPTELDDNPLFDDEAGRKAYSEQIQETLGSEAAVAVTAPFAME